MLCAYVTPSLLDSLFEVRPLVFAHRNMKYPNHVPLVELRNQLNAKLETALK